MVMFDWIKRILLGNDFVQVKILLDNMTFFPQRQTSQSAGYDLRAAISQPIVLEKNKPVLIETGIRIELPKDYHAKICIRSSLGKKGILIPNAPGIIDSDYRDEIKVILMNTQDEAITINPQERIAQMLVEKNLKIIWEFVSELSKTDRNLGGFGSTGAL